MTTGKLATRLCYNEHMNNKRELRREFARAYFSVVPGKFRRMPRGIAAHTKALQTLVVDTVHLTDGTQRLAEVWVLQGTNGTPLDTAAKATMKSAQPFMRGLYRALHTMPAHKPAHVGSGAVEWTAWYHGDAFEFAMAGNVSNVLRYCDLTDNERERIMITARRLSRNGDLVWATAKGISRDKMPPRGTLMFDGLVSCTPQLLPGTVHAATRLRQLGIRLVYVTAAHEDIATYIARAAHITDYPKVARHARFTPSFEHAIYAHADRVSARRILRELPQPALVARHPLTDFVRMLECWR